MPSQTNKRSNPGIDRAIACASAAMQAGQYYCVTGTGLRPSGLLEKSDRQRYENDTKELLGHNTALSEELKTIAWSLLRELNVDPPQPLVAHVVGKTPGSRVGEAIVIGVMARDTPRENNQAMSPSGGVQQDGTDRFVCQGRVTAAYMQSILVGHDLSKSDLNLSDNVSGSADTIKTTAVNQGPFTKVDRLCLLAFVNSSYFFERVKAELANNPQGLVEVFGLFDNRFTTGELKILGKVIKHISVTA
jgi:hypothetical protein